MTPLAADGWQRFNHYMRRLGFAEKFRVWTDCDGVIENAASRGDLLTNVTLYWVTGTAASSGRFYRETRLAEPFTPTSTSPRR
jgi:hypothetical protein